MANKRTKSPEAKQRTTGINLRFSQEQEERLHQGLQKKYPDIEFRRIGEIGSKRGDHNKSLANILREELLSAVLERRPLNQKEKEMLGKLTQAFYTRSDSLHQLYCDIVKGVSLQQSGGSSFSNRESQHLHEQILEKHEETRRDFQQLWYLLCGKNSENSK